MALWRSPTLNLYVYSYSYVFLDYAPGFKFASALAGAPYGAKTLRVTSFHAQDLQPHDPPGAPQGLAAGDRIRTLVLAPVLL